VRVGEIRPLLGDLASEKQDTRLRAAIHLSAVPELAPHTVPVLLETLAGTGPGREQDAALAALASLGPHAKDALPRLREVFAAPFEDLDRTAVAVAILRIAGEDAAAVEYLLSLLRAPWSLARLEVVRGLRSSGVLAGPAVPDLLRALDEALAVRQATAGLSAVQAFEKEAWKYGQSVALPPEILETLRGIGPVAAEAVPRIEALASSEDPLLRYLAARTLAAISGGRGDDGRGPSGPERDRKGR
jgi:hypothetical protein